MAKISIVGFDEAEPVDPGVFRETLSEGAEARSLLKGAGDPLHLHLSSLREGAVARWADSTTGHLVYVWQGSVAAGEVVLGAGSVLIVEHGGGAEVRSLSDDTLLLVFNAAEGSRIPTRPGGHTHRLPTERVPRKRPMVEGHKVGGAIYADSACPTCSLWLHGNNFPAGDEVALHHHSEDEIIVVTEGEMLLGNRSCGPGTALAIQRDARYSFRAGAKGLSFINFRADPPTHTAADTGHTIDESATFRRLVGEVSYV